VKASRILLFIICLIIWFMLSWSFNQKSIIVGIIVSAVISFIEGDLFTKNPHKMTHIKRYLWFLYYVGVLLCDMVLANVEILVFVLTFWKKLDPGVFSVQSTLKSETGITALANTITLIQGTATIDIDEQSRMLEVQFLMAAQKEKIIRRIKAYEKILKGIYEEL